MLRRVCCLLLLLFLLPTCALALTEAEIDGILEEMTLREKVQQMFLTTPLASGDPMDWEPGGYILFASDFEKRDAASAREMIRKLRESAKLPLFIAVDEEGGSVNRVSKYKAYRDSAFPSPRKVYASGGWDGIAEDTREKAKLLLGLGINLNLAPVADVAESKKSYIYPRAFSTDAEEVSRYVSSVVAVMNEEGIGACLKHFPGYGGNSDTHRGMSMDKRSLTEFETKDLLPFAAGIEEGVDAVMVSHNIVTCFDGENPASLSKAVYDYLRRDMGFEGVVITDELGMRAISRFTKNPCVLAIRAGSDLLCVKSATKHIDKVLAAIESGEISRERIDESVRRILLWKCALP
ncbi:MAG: glycoside hydrolase family 3 protein [Christensenellales bacterium]|jgi:beta-N-acetylhexosaminidase